MSTMIQIRNVPDDLHREIKSRAALEGMSMSDWLLREIGKVVERPTRREVLARLARRAPVALETSAAQMVREERDRR